MFENRVFRANEALREIIDFISPDKVYGIWESIHSFLNRKRVTPLILVE